MKRINWLLTGIIVLAAFLRFWGIASTPPSMYWDEVSQGYNAYSMLKTGGYDEHHEFLPIARFIAFGDYKAPVNIYFTVPAIALFGKNTFAVRFASAFFGTLTVWLTFFLVRQLFLQNKRKEWIAYASAFLLAISPVHIQLSRVAYEANIATFFTVLGSYLFLLAINKNRRWLIGSSIAFIISMYAFNANRIFIPTLILLLIVLYCKRIFSKEYIGVVLLSGVFGIILLLPFLFYLKTPESKLRFNEVSIFSYYSSDVVNQSNVWIAQENASLVAKVLHNRRVIFGLLYMKHYFDFFNPQYLFITGDVNPRFSSQDTGELYLWELPIVLMGIYALVKYRNKSTWILFGWFLLAPVAAATAKETPHALRSETYLPMYQIFGGYGVITLYTFLLKTKKYLAQLGIIMGVIVVGISLIFFLHNYFIDMPLLYSYDWQYGYKQAYATTQALQPEYDTIAFTKIYGRPYIYLLWYGNISPQTFWKDGEVTKDAFGFYNVSKIGKYEFRDTLIDASDKTKRVLYVGTPSQIPSTLKKIKTIYFLNGQPDFIIATNK